MKCSSCESFLVQKVCIRDNMYVSNTNFQYYYCKTCNSYFLDRNTVSNDYTLYPKDYYSFKVNKKESILTKLLKDTRTQYYTQKSSFLGLFLSLVFPNDCLKPFSKISVKKTDKILDIGCGSAHLLKQLNSAGFNNLTGVDPYINKDINYGENLKIYKKEIHDINTKYDIICLNHSFEHMPDQLSVLLKLESILEKNGHIIIRIPIIQNRIINKFGMNWIQFDAPRHYTLHSEKGFSNLIKKTNLHIAEKFFDSTSFVFWGSYLATLKIPLSDRGKMTLKAKVVIKFITICGFLYSRYINFLKQGDQSCFILKKL